MEINMNARALRDHKNPNDWQHAQFDLLLKLDAFCRKNSIMYSLDFGSMIGAVRHHAYIPWDNDIDVTMHMKDYKRFLRLMKQGKGPEGCLLLDRSIDPEYEFEFGRFVDVSTSCIVSGVGNQSSHCGLFVDVFCLRPLPKNAVKKKAAIRDFLVYEEAHCLCSRRAGFRTEAFKKRWKELKAIEKDSGEEAAFEWIDKQANKKVFRKPDWYMINSGGTYNGWALRKREWVESVVEMPVWGHMLPVFSGYLDILRGDYGDSWRYWPADEQQFYPYRANLNIPGEFFINDYKQLYDMEELLSALKKGKALSVKNAFLRDSFSPRKYAALGIASLSAPTKAVASGLNLEELARSFAQGQCLDKAPEVAELFDAFYVAQTFERCRYWHVAIPIKADWLVACLWALLITRKDYWTARKVLDLQLDYSSEDAHLKKNESLAALDVLLDHISDMHLFIDKNDAKAVEGILDKIVNQAPWIYEARIGSIWLSARQDPSWAKGPKAQEDLAYCLDNGEYLAYYADALEALGEVDEADKLRRDAVGKTTNGMVVTSIREKLGEKNA